MRAQKLLFAGLVFLLGNSFAMHAQSIELRDIWSTGKYRSSGVTSPQSMNDGTHYTAVEFGTGGFAITRFDYRTGLPVDTLLETANITETAGFNPIYSFSADENKLLLHTEYSPIYRYSFESLVYTYDFKTSQIQAISPAPVMYPEFSPTGNHVAYVQNNNLHVYHLDEQKSTALTRDGEKNKLINGGGDWVYEEEFTLSRAFEWSPDGEHVAFLKFNESAVPEFSMDVYGDLLYPQQERFKYPKAGEINSTVSAWVANVESSSPQEIVLDNFEFEYIPRIYWKNSNELVLLLVNRLQNQFDWVLVNLENGSSSILFSQKSETYLEVRDPVLFTDRGEMIYQGEESGFNHIYLREVNGKTKQLTRGSWEVTAVYGMDNNGYVYYQSGQPTPMDRQLHKVSTKGKSYALSPQGGSYDAQFSSNFKYFLRNYSDANTPPIYSMCKGSGEVVRIIESNDDLRSTLTANGLPERTFIEIPIQSEEGNSLVLNGWMIKPPAFDDSKSHPLLMFVYGGPGSQTVTNAWGGSNQLWFSYLAQQGYIVVSVDGRGTGARGNAFRSCTYKTLGKIESHDQIEAAHYLAELPYVQEDQIGIFGWSYGGYMSSLCLSLGADIFSRAISVAPVTNWRYYDSIYTERYMGLPSENGEGYDAHSPISHTDKIRGDLLLVHGSADDNVHFQNSMEYVRRLVNSDVDFEFMAYPDKNHGIYGGNTRLHLYRKMSNFLLENIEE